MASIPSKAANRIIAAIKRFQPIVSAAKTRDVGESDTVTIVVDLLAEMFGFDKYSEITSEFSIRGTFCDLAIKIDGVIQTIIEVKAIGIELKDVHVKQAVDYAANQGVDWVVLTNAQSWKIFKVTFEKPINQELILEFNVSDLNSRSDKDLAMLYALCKEGLVKSALGELHQQRQALSRFSLAATLMSEPVLTTLRRELRRISPDARIEIDEIRNVLSTEVIKRDVLEGDKALEAKKKISKSVNKVKRAAAARKEQPDPVAGSMTEILQDSASVDIGDENEQ